MKSLFIKTILLSSLVVLHACQQEELSVAPLHSASSDRITLEEAQTIYARYLTNDRSARTLKRKHKETPMWQAGEDLTLFNGKRALVVQVEEAADALTLLSFDKDSRTTRSFQELFTPVKLVFYKDSKGKEHLERMYIKADAEYAQRKQFRFEDADFSGRIWYEDMDDNFLRAFFYKDGKLIGKQVPEGERPEGDKKKNARTAYTCEYIYETTTTTTTYYSITCSSSADCGPPKFMYNSTSTTTTVWYESCYPDPNDPAYYPAGSGALSFIEDPGFWSWFPNLNALEKDWLLANPGKAEEAYLNFRKAEVSSQGRFGGATKKDQDGTNQNAYKHAYAAALHTRSWGPNVARDIMNNHEGIAIPPVFGSSEYENLPLPTKMDYHNNNLGVHAALFCECDGETLRDNIQTRIGSGQGMRYIYANGLNFNSLQPTTSANLDND